jgi:tetratricopeptide (TPR) repeat protein
MLTSAMSADPKKTADCLALMVWLKIPAEQMKKALPERTAAYLAFGDYRAAVGDYEQAGKAYMDALAHLSKEKTVEKDFFLHIYRFFSDREEKDKALAVTQQALVYFPDDEKLKRFLEPSS